MTNDNTFDSPDDGVVVGEPSPRQSVFRIPRTQAIPLFDPPPSFPPKGAVEAQSDVSDAAQEEESEEEQADLAAMYVFRRHWREPLLRILPTKYAPRWYLVLHVFGLVALLVSVALYATSDNDAVLLAGCATLVGFSAFPAIREIHRWRHRVVTLQLTSTGIRIIYQEPSAIWLGFNGDGDGNVTKLEGSSEFNTHINWPNRLIFWGCGDLLIAGKVEAGGSPLLENVPKIKQVREFLNQGL